ncbi:AcvB/VirJ family lysyl-phosphatidylglycerol hydrolase [Rhizobium sp. 0TCS1.26]|uniref:virulence factor family protein n=1 Tax=Rhizobium sp. 0TCS1.26 TaxID=3142623 RepID=UPI003D267AA2
MMKNLLTLALIGIFGIATAGSAAAQAQPPAAAGDPALELGMIPTPHIFKPVGTMKSNIFLLSDADGWNDVEDSQAKALAAKGALVVGIDLPSYIAALNKDEDDCIYMISDVESVAQQVQRSLGSGSYRSPVIAGTGAAGALVLGMIAQSPAATIGEAIAVDPQAGITLTKQLCTPAEKQQDGERIIYGLTEGALPAPVTIYLSGSADAEGRKHAEALQASHPDIDIEEAQGSAADTLAEALTASMDAAGSDDATLGLPLTILEAAPKLDTMAIVYSGDGGWRDIDSEVAAALQADGVPVVGVDALRYFWSRKTPDETAADLSRIIRTYRKQWNVSHVVLIGYSFGADILPSTFNRLPPADRSKVSLLSLLALSHVADFEISVSGWLGGQGDGDGGDPTEALQSIDPKLVQCVYGTEDDDEACKGLAARGVEIIGIEGGHHFDEDYEKLAGYILKGLRSRLGK